LMSSTPGKLIQALVASVTSHLRFKTQA
jgi:hypothetical protein